MLSLDFSTNVSDFLDKLDKHIMIRIVERLEKLKENPVPSDVKFMCRDNNGDKIFRYRVGDYRALYKVKYKESVILITKLEKRPRVYDKY